MKNYFQSLASAIFRELHRGEHLFLNLAGDDSQFIRINEAKVRQSGVVENYFLDFTFVLGEVEGSLKKGTGQITLCLDEQDDLNRLREWLDDLRKELPNFPIDPYAELPAQKSEESVHESSASLLARQEAAKKLVNPWTGYDVAGFYAAGPVVRGMANSAGLFHWFKTESFSFDYSLFTPAQKALKAHYFGTRWDDDKYSRQVQDSILKRSLLEKISEKISPGQYRVYLTPAAVADILNILGYAFGELSIQTSKSAMRFLRSGEKRLSDKFTLIEDFTDGLVPQFNEEGELAQNNLVLVENGKLQSTLIHSRTAKEYGLRANGAGRRECLRAPVVPAGNLGEPEILMSLGTGIYISNLHYLNWSDEVNGRITGMTRYACFWITEGKISSPIENLRFDENIFDLLGSSLEQLTSFDEYIPETLTYGYRQIGGIRTPGMLLSKMNFTL
jgi:predicted Zn-dependent protease